MPAMSDSESIATQVWKILDKLPVQAQRLVLAYARSLDFQFKALPANNGYPLRSTATFDLSPSASALDAKEWNAVRGVLVGDPD